MSEILNDALETAKRQLKAHKDICQDFSCAKSFIQCAIKTADEASIYVGCNLDTLDDAYNYIDNFHRLELDVVAKRALEVSKAEKKNNSAAEVAKLRAKFREGSSYRSLGVTVNIIHKFREGNELYVVLYSDVNDENKAILRKIFWKEGGEAFNHQGREFTPNDYVFSEEECERLGVTND